ncbi:hypothetical protein BAZ12_00980 [Elizabethkingia miricola]|uniref:DUF2059 domain-containing protein n=1 Tax=Elizabethkingia miricola TaxID=172045 RepID=A0ABD4DKQ5_ELIMR|nr:MULTISPECIES: DUF2059 domain-containing protein [Elizabethkingia]KUY17477.1 hypothetical protein ATB95_14110 [Elizabethkingia miricola]MCL1652756.1 DUF2059 domain-containing protein [Elizabethkingia miricola]MCL1680127.1 DUF2059 domain-containing protein [Elizabethkingia miricola]OPC11681.1 hypothetical protein BAY01_11670 [Elizabethkingia miricola]OPC68534.1 hypothetical protein BAZ13_14035 [Elizabethkingia miricola]
MKKITILFLIMTGSLIFAQEQTISPAKKEKIKTLLKITNMTGIANQMMGNMLNYYQANYKQVPAEYWTEVKKEATDSINEFEGLMIPTYSKYYTEKELDDMIAFYKTPTGKKMIEIMPDMTKESMQKGQEWGMKLGQKVIKKINEKYPAQVETIREYPPSK